MRVLVAYLQIPVEDFDNTQIQWCQTVATILPPQPCDTDIEVRVVVLGIIRGVSEVGDLGSASWERAAI